MNETQRRVETTQQSNPEPEIYREDDMRMALTADEWQDYRGLDVEAQVCAAHLVMNGMCFNDAKRYDGQPNKPFDPRTTP